MADRILLLILSALPRTRPEITGDRRLDYIKGDEAGLPWTYRDLPDAGLDTLSHRIELLFRRLLPTPRPNALSMNW